MKKIKSILFSILYFLIFALTSNSAFALELENTNSISIPEMQLQNSGTVLWQGFDHSWEKTPHRLNQFGSAFLNIDFQPGENEARDSVTTTQSSLFKVGEEEDVGHVKIKGQYIESSVLGFHEDSINENCLDVKGLIGDTNWVKCRVSLDLGEIDFKKYDQITVVLRGFRLKETSYSSGYNTRGFTLRLIPISHNRNTYVFDAFFLVHPEHSPDRPLPEWMPLGDDCGKCDHYEYKTKLFYTLIGIKNGAGVLTDAESSGTNSYRQHITMTPNKIPDMASEDLRKAQIFGVPGYDSAAVGIQGFSWHLNDWDSTKKDGRYIRELRFDISKIQYDPDSGTADFFTNMYFSNSGLIPMGFDVSFKMWNVLIQTRDTHFNLSPQTWESGTVQKGETSFSQDLGYEFD